MANFGDIKSDELKDYYYTPSGVIYPYAGANLTAGWIWCDGTSYGTATYSSLFTALGYSYGGAGANFNVPDLRGRVGAGKDNMGGVAAGRLTAAGAGFAGTVLNSTGGTQTVTLTSAQSGQPAVSTELGGAHTPSGTIVNSGELEHTHEYTVSNDSNYIYKLQFNAAGVYAVNLGVYAANTGGIDRSLIHSHGLIMSPVSNHTHSIVGANASSAHSNTQPTIIINYIIKT